MKVKQYINWCYMVCLILLAVACSDNEAPVMHSGDRVLEIDYAGFTVDGKVSQAPGENVIGDLKACFFKSGKLESVSDLKPENGRVVMELSGAGNLYLTTNTGTSVDWEKVKTMSETEWEKMAVKLAGTENPCFLSAKIPVGNDVSSVAKVMMKRGVVRFDLKFGEVTTGVDKVKFTGMADCGFLFEQPEVKSPDTAKGEEKQIVFNTAQKSNIAGLAYFYEQQMKNAMVEVTLQGGKVVSVPLPETLKRNTVYTLLLQEGGVSVSLKVDEWDEQADMGMENDVVRRLTIEEQYSDLKGKASLMEGNTGVSISYAASEIIVGVNCDEELVPVNDIPNVRVEPVSEGASTLSERNRFRITKQLFVPERPSESVILKFRRKRFTEVYDEDCIKVNLESNPDRVEGLMKFDHLTYTCDFDRYLDNEIGVFTLAEGKKLEVSVDADDPWVRAVQSKENPLKYVIEAGWKPNDINADGRKQTAQIIITALDGTQEVYTVKRKNFGLPVTFFRGLWWCSYNARGNSRRFEDQILSSDDPAAKKGMSVFEYLNSCTPEEYMDIWGWGYQGLSGEGLKVVYRDGKFRYDGFKTSVSGFIPQQDPKLLAPEGYELVDMSDYVRILKKGHPMKMDTSEQLISTDWSDIPNEGQFVGSMNGKRDDLHIGGVKMESVDHLLVTSSYFPEYGVPVDLKKGITLYGPGSQWNNNGIVHKNILITAHSSEGEELYNRNNTGIIRQTNTAANCVRVIRFKKSPVNYIYGLDKK